MSEISILIPSFKEYENLNYLLPKISESIDNNFKPHIVNVIVIDCVELDQKTKVLCEKFGYTYINRGPTNSFGDALRSGIDYVKKNLTTSEWVIVMDSDGSHDPGLFQEFSKFINSNSIDLVIASRYVKGGSTENNFILIFLSLVVNFIYRKYFNLNVKDVSNNFRLYSFNTLRNLKLEEKNFEIVEEILIKIIKNDKNIKIVEIPSRFLIRKYGKSKRNLIAFTISYLKSLNRLKRFTK